LNINDIFSRRRIITASAFILIAAAYLGHTWGHELASFQGDEVIYLLTAEYFSPWMAHSAIAAYTANNSQFPPLFPLVLGLTGGGNIFAANLVNTVLFLSAFVVLYRWMLVEGITEFRALLLTGIFAILPGTCMQALFVCSESLYLLLSLIVLLTVARAEREPGGSWLLVAAISVSAATLTRSAGLALLAAFVVYLLWRRATGKWLLIAMAAALSASWSLYTSLFGGDDRPGYMLDFLKTYSVDPFSAFVHQITAEMPRLGNGLLSDFTTSPVGMSVIGVMGVIFLLAAAYRVYLRKLDGIYVFMYVGMILLWPFPVEAKRFDLVIVPIILMQGFLLVTTVSRLKFKSLRFDVAGFIYLSVIFLLALPSLVLIAGNHLQPVSRGMEPFKKAAWWYGWYRDGSLIPRPRDVVYAETLARGLRVITRYVPEDECIYSVKPAVVSFYSRRINKLPPREDSSDVEFNRAIDNSKCHFFFFMNDISPSISMSHFYPIQRLDDKVQQILEVSFMYNNEKVVLGMLGKLGKNRDKRERKD
jgi:hypothetical protein